jgi:hypothetical protein
MSTANKEALLDRPVHTIIKTMRIDAAPRNRRENTSSQMERARLYYATVSSSLTPTLVVDRWPTIMDRILLGNDHGL